MRAPPKSVASRAFEGNLPSASDRSTEFRRPIGHSGKFLVRTTPRVHRRLAEIAARTGRSLNAVANELLDA
ncbi:toxin-antitoxin system HicB family antitoxin [Gordonia malaquae]|uniref:toxin-antitoxin system HicB family antitoxin n=1 Tax=Gordonia malaquae TaxID=410332 RepID=UPI003BF90560